MMILDTLAVCRDTVDCYQAFMFCEELGCGWQVWEDEKGHNSPGYAYEPKMRKTYIHFGNPVVI